jgi:hypothetical protein
MPVTLARGRVASTVLFALLVALSSAAVVSAQPRIDVNGVGSPGPVQAASGSLAQVAISGGPANTTDWIGLYAAGAADAASLTWYYLSGTTTPPPAGLAAAAVSVLLPTTPGDYEVRLFAANGYTKLATGPVIHVLVSAATIRVNGVLPPASVSASPATALAVAVEGGPANPTDWIGLFSQGTADTAPLAWQYLSGSTTAPAIGRPDATLQFLAPAPQGTYELRLFAAGGYARLVVGASIIVGPPQASLLVNASADPNGVSAAAGSVAVLAVASGPGNATDWVGLYPMGAADGAPLTWCYLSGTTTAPSTGLAATTLSLLLPTTPGGYEFRLFAANGYTRVATSSAVHVLASPATIRVNGVLAPAAVSVSPGTSLTVAVDGGPANPTNWIGLFSVGAADTTCLEWQYLNGSTAAPSAGFTQATLAFFAPVASGTYELRLFSGGGYARLAVSATIAVAAPTGGVLVNGTAPPASVTVAAGSLALLTVTGAPGNTTDWIGLYRAGAEDTACLDWRYLNGLTTPPSVALPHATVSWLMPAAPGSYEFRLFAHNAYQRVALSGPVTVPSSAALVTVNGARPPQSATAGAGTMLTIAIANGPGNPTDWVGLFAAGAPDATPLAWQYLNGSTTPPESGLSSASLRMLAPTAGGAVDIRFFAANTYDRLAASGLVTIAPPSARIAVNGIAPPASVSVTPGAVLTVSVQAAPGNRADWMGLYRHTDPDTAPLTWAYLSGTTTLPVDPLTSGTWSVTAPSEAGSYEVRLFVDNSYAGLATSAEIVVGRPTVSVELTSPFPGTVFPVGMPVTLSADAPATGIMIARVEFELDGIAIGSSNQPPFTGLWTANAPGDHIFVAVAVDDQGARTPSSPVSVSVSSSGPGVLGPPVVTPPGGRFGTPPTVTMEAASGATIRYTTDGTEPDETSPLYAGPITIPAGERTVLLAKAFQSGWTPSPYAWIEFIIDWTPPEIRVFTIPGPNGAGWNNSPVTLSFRCSDPAGTGSCTAPVTVATEGVQTVEGIGADAFGNEGRTTTTVHIDPTPPALVVSGEPIRQTDGAAVTLAGTVADGLSGVARVTCNSVSATLDATGGFSCDVPLQPGLNAVVVQALDVAGNGRSAGLRVTRLAPVESVRISPVKATIGIGESRNLWPRDQAGQSVSNVEWSVDDPGVVSLTTTGGRASVTGLGPGTATVTATLGDLTASATVVVSAGTLAVGATLWTSPPGMPGAVSVSRTLLANRVDASVPDLYVLESTPTGSQLLRGVFADGTPGDVWTVTADGTTSVELRLADRSGGVILDSWTSMPEVQQQAFVRIPGTASGIPWRYEPAGGRGGLLGQSPDGTVYVADGTGVVGLDGESGTVKFRYRPPGTNLYAVYNIDCHEGYHSISEEGAGVGGGVIGYDGALYAMVRTSTYVYDYFSQSGCHYDHVIPTEHKATVSLLRVTPDGASSLVELHTEESDHARYLQGDTLVPDPRGGVHAQWNWVAWDGSGDTRHGRVQMGGSVESQSGPLPFDRVGDGVGFDGGGTAYDLDTGTVKFSPGEGMQIVATIAGGGVAVSNGQTLTELDGAGATVREATVPTTPASSTRLMAGTFGVGPSYGGGDLWFDIVSDGLVSLEGPGVAANTDEYPDWNGAPQPKTQVFSDPESAVIAFYRTSWMSSTKEQREYGGIVCKNNERDYRLTPPKKGPLCTATECEVDLDSETCPAGMATSGEYHTHPWAVYFDGTNGPSGPDRARILNQAKTWPLWPASFVGTSCGEVWYYTPVHGKYEVAQDNVTLPGQRYILFDTGVFGKRPPCSHDR